MYVAGHSNAHRDVDVDVHFGVGAMAAERFLYLRALLTGQTAGRPGCRVLPRFARALPFGGSSTTSLCVIGALSARVAVFAISALFAFGTRCWVVAVFAFGSRRRLVSVFARWASLLGHSTSVATLTICAGVRTTHGLPANAAAVSAASGASRAWIATRRARS